MRVPNTILITGASRGIGARIATLLAPGRSLILTFGSDRESAERVRDECLAQGADTAYVFKLDLLSIESIHDLALHVGATDVHDLLLIHNAGVIVKKPLEEQNEREIHAQVMINVGGPMLLTRYLLPYLSGVAFIGSDVGVHAIPGMPVYCMTKSAIRNFAHAIALDDPLLPVSVINPDKTATGMNDGEGRSVEDTAKAIVDALMGTIRPDVEIKNFSETHLNRHFAESLT